MSLQTYRWLQAVMGALLAGALTKALISQNIVYALLGAVVFAVVLRVARRMVKEVVADERDLKQIGKAANVALRLFGLITVAVAFVFLYEGRTNSTYETIGLTLMYALVGLLVLYRTLMEYYRRGESTAARVFITGAAILLALIVEIAVSHFLK